MTNNVSETLIDKIQVKQFLNLIKNLEHEQCTQDLFDLQNISVDENEDLIAIRKKRPFSFTTLDVADSSKRIKSNPPPANYL